jgi:hypothetical protein
LSLSIYQNATGIPNNPGMIIAQRRPMRSPAKPQAPLDKKTTRFAKMIGVAIIAGLKPRSFCRCVANIPLIE